MGHEKCKVICMPIEKWGEELENEYSYYQSTSMIQELDEVTAKLKIERDYLKQANEVHRKLIEELLSKQGYKELSIYYLKQQDYQHLSKMNIIKL